MTLSDRKIKIPPFKITTRDAAPWTEQVEKGLRQAIATGFYADGDFIPSYIELADHLGVSTIVVRRAVAALIADGLCKTRRGIGISICSKAPASVGNVLVITAGDRAAYRHYMAKFVEHLRRHLSASHLSLSRAVVPVKKGREDYSDLSSALNQHVSLIVCLDRSKGIDRVVADTGIPYVVMGPAPKPPAAIGYLVGDSRRTAVTLARKCSACGARRVLVVCMSRTETFHVVPGEVVSELEKASIEARDLVICPSRTEITGLNLSRDTIDTFLGLAKSGVLECDGFRPDLVIILDDFIAQGALLAMTAAGIRIPEDLQMVTMANKDLGPVWLKPLTRFEVDAAAEARAMAGLVLECLRDRKSPHTRKSSVRFVDGETTLVAPRGGAEKQADRR